MGRQYDTVFICNSFFGYAKAITGELERRGASVLWAEDRPALDLVTKSKVRFAPKLAEKQSREFFDDIIRKVADHPIRRVLIVKGEAMTPEMIGRMRAAFPAAEFTFYLWDSFRNMPKDSPEKLQYFDRLLSFDPVDCTANPQLAYRPLFFLENYRQIAERQPDIDVLFLGTLHSDRLAVAQRLERALPAGLHFRKVFYLRSKLAYDAQRLIDADLRREPADSFTTVSVSASEVADLMARSRAVLDIERPIQTGYTIRTLEVLASGRKLITTNPQLRNADFYDPRNIAVIDRNAPKIPAEFFASPYNPVPEEVLQRYSLEHWVDDVLPDLRKSQRTRAA